MAKKITKAKRKKIDEQFQRAVEIKKAKKDVLFPIVAFDQATKCGVAYQLPGRQPKTELWNLTLKSYESNGMKWIRFEGKVRDFLKKIKAKAVAYELPAGRNLKPIIHSSKMIGIIEKVATELEIEYIEFSSSQVKKFATGKGNANKEMMIEYAKKLWKFEGQDDNEADALHILHYLKTKL